MGVQNQKWDEWARLPIVPFFAPTPLARVCEKVRQVLELRIVDAIQGRGHHRVAARAGFVTVFLHHVQQKLFLLAGQAGYLVTALVLRQMAGATQSRFGQFPTTLEAGPVHTALGRRGCRLRRKITGQGHQFGIRDPVEGAFHGRHIPQAFSNQDQLVFDEGFGLGRQRGDAGNLRHAFGAVTGHTLCGPRWGLDARVDLRTALKGRLGQRG